MLTESGGRSVGCKILQFSCVSFRSFFQWWSPVLIFSCVFSISSFSSFYSPVLSFWFLFVQVLWIVFLLYLSYPLFDSFLSLLLTAWTNLHVRINCSLHTRLSTCFLKLFYFPPVIYTSRCSVLSSIEMMDKKLDLIGIEYWILFSTHHILFIIFFNSVILFLKKIFNFAF